MQIEQLLRWSGMVDTEHTSGLNEEELAKFRCISRLQLKFILEYGRKNLTELLMTFVSIQGRNQDFAKEGRGLENKNFCNAILMTYVK